MIGRVSGSQLASTVPALIGWSALTFSMRAVRHLVALALAAVLVGDDDFAGARDHHQLALAVGHVAHRRVEADDAVGLRLDAGGHRRTRRRTTDVEGAHRQLRARLADRLRRDHADRFADVDQAAAAEVAAVALGADAEARVRRSARVRTLTSSTPAALERVERVFVEHLAGGAAAAPASRDAATSIAATRPRMRSRSDLDHLTAFDQRAHVACRCCVPQSSSVTTRSCVTSTRRRVR